MPTHAVLDDEACPIPDGMLGQLYRASPHGLAVLVETIPPAVRGLLALYCHRRSHMQSLALAIAATCEEYDLTQPGGQAGAAIYAKAREGLHKCAPEPHIGNRRKITLATGQLLNLIPVDDELDEEIEEMALDATPLIEATEAAGIPAVA